MGAAAIFTIIAGGNTSIFLNGNIQWATDTRTLGWCVGTGSSTCGAYLSNLFHHRFQGPLARKLATWSGMDRVFFSNSGTEAVEGALKLARVAARKRGASDKTRILAIEGSFHGRTLGALSITHPAQYRDPFAPLLPGVEFVRFNDVADLQVKFWKAIRVCHRPRGYTR